MVKYLWVVFLMWKNVIVEENNFIYIQTVYDSFVYKFNEWMMWSTDR